MAGYIKNILGNRYGKLIVVEGKGIRRSPCGAGAMVWICQCDCGKRSEVRTAALTGGRILSCGCGIVTSLKKRLTIHGMGNSANKEFNAWKSMKARCYRKTRKGYDLYGGRGITICKRWLEAFQNFYDDMGKAPTQKHSIDRKDVNGNYEPSNCRWATQKEQMNNVRRNVKVKYKEEVLTISQLCEKISLSREKVKKMIEKGECELYSANI